MTKEVNYHIWEDEPIEANYYSHIQLPHGGQIYDSIGKITIQKEDVLYLDYGRSLMEYTRSGKGYVTEFPFGKIHLHGIASSVVLDKPHEIRLAKSSEEEFNNLIKKQKERIDNFIPHMKETYIATYMCQFEKNKKNNLILEKEKKAQISNAIDKMEVFFKKPKL